MLNRSLPVLGAMCTLAFASTAWAADPIPESSDSLSEYKQMGEWTIYADATRGSCLAERVGPEGNVMQMGLTQNQSDAYVGVFTPAKMDFDRSQPIEIAVDGQVFEGRSHGIRSRKLGGEYFGGYIVTNNPNLINAIAEGSELVAFPERKGLFVIDLTGTKVAIEEVRTCTAELAG